MRSLLSQKTNTFILCTWTMCSLSDLNNKGGDGKKGESIRKENGRKETEVDKGGSWGNNTYLSTWQIKMNEFLANISLR